MNNLLKTSFYISKIKTMLNLINNHSGSYKSWSDAYRDSKTYQDHSTIVQIQKAALQAKKYNKYFRDGIVFEDYEYSFELNNLILVTSIIKKKLNINKPLKIIDFGGGLGSQQVQFHKYCQDFKINIDYNWEVVEQESLIVGLDKVLKNKHIKFTKEKDFNFQKNIADIIILGSVLQFLEKPFVIIDRIIESNVRYIYIDRTPFWGGTKDIITVLKGNKFIKSSYPCYVFSFGNFINSFKNNYILKHVFISKEGNFFFNKARNGTYKGMVWEKK